MAVKNFLTEGLAMSAFYGALKMLVLDDYLARREREKQNQPEKITEVSKKMP